MLFRSQYSGEFGTAWVALFNLRAIKGINDLQIHDKPAQLV